MSKKLLIAVLAAGASRRLGTPKQLLTLDNEPLLRRQCRIALEAELGSVVAILGCHAELCRAAVADLPIEIVLNSEWQEGMASSVRAAASLAEDRGCDGLIILLVDQYQLESQDLRLLFSAWQNKTCQIAVSTSVEYKGPPVFFAAACFAELKKLHGEQGAKSLIQKMPASSIQNVTVDRAAIDCDLLEDLRKMELEGQRKAVDLLLG